MKLIKKAYQSYLSVVFPTTCVCCGAAQEKENQYLCSWCKNERFERASTSHAEITPQQVEFVFSMWSFDKGGYLQGLLHDLKYNFLKGVGEELGEITAQTFLDASAPETIEELNAKKPLIVPVPLYKSKKRKRGYNQAGAIADGFGNVTGWEVIEEGIVVRNRNTRTQTGLTSNERSKNLKGAFEIENSRELEDRFLIIIDDVFTTGATTFELASTLLQYKTEKAGIVTVAKT